MSMKSCSLKSLVIFVGLFFLLSAPTTVAKHKKRKQKSDAWFLDNYFPECAIEAFYVPALNKASNDATNQTINTTVSLDLSLKIENKYYIRKYRIVEVYYETFDINLYYYHYGSIAGDHRNILMRLPIGNTSTPKFTQSRNFMFENPRHLSVKIQTFGVPWEELKMAVSNGGSTMFGVELFSRVSYLRRKFVLPSGRHTVKLGVNVTVNDQGNESVHGGLRLTSASRRINSPCSFLVLALSILGLIV